MQWDDDAIFLTCRAFGETDVIATLLSRENGLVAGIVKGGASRTRRGMLQPGNVLAASWKARLPEQLGLYSLEPKESLSAYALTKPQNLTVLQSCIALLSALLPEREAQPNLYDRLLTLLRDMRDMRLLVPDYVRFELALLQAAGFGLDLDSCASTGLRETLIYVSPRSGRAVSAEAGAPYHDRLLPLPAFLREEAQPELEHERAACKDGLRLTGHFLWHHVMEPQGRPMPAARDRLVAGLNIALQAA